MYLHNQDIFQTHLGHNSAESFFLQKYSFSIPSLAVASSGDYFPVQKRKVSSVHQEKHYNCSAPKTISYLLIVLGRDSDKLAQF